ncbi:16364_t:CDS:2 [Entrophospora sp. SA101]|nr:16364_t:CDS:2 [Entrophospora sp. SA101]CAJ0901495.1 2756_t:CDS:2 [Entrophospora sp. SA101]
MLRKNKQYQFEVYHIPKGYEVLLVPRDDSNLSPVNILATTKRISPATAADNLKIQQQKTSTLSTSSNGSNNSSWRRRKQNGHIPRPKNCFMAYREHIQHEILSQNPGMNNKYVSVVAAEKWNKESEETKNFWREKAQLLKIEHGLKYPNYKFAPKKKQPKSAANNNDSNDDIMSVKTNKVIKKSSSSSSKILTEGMAKNLLNNNNENFENNGLIVDNIWSHYRSSSVESITSWTSVDFQQVGKSLKTDACVWDYGKKKLVLCESF